ncbi:ADIPOR-like receptor [Zalerion maritima]|uniref:ADIPOR-like receptor n=1 Tax=Zalerion maritima TaxID=339359 RepID=A0AAD5WQN1_9PEZI|nr:ADIPOR-like receptor [Zalerion maritima]
MTIDSTFDIRDGLRSRIAQSSAILKTVVLDVSSTEEPDLRRQRSPCLTRRQQAGHDRATLEWHEIKPWQQRANCSVKECFYSWTYLHNETINIYSHLLGAVLYLSLPVIMFVTSIPPRWHIATRLDILACSSYFLGVGTCFVLSTAFHTLHPHSSPLYHFLISLDILGILALMSSATFPLLHFSFPCHPVPQAMYFILSLLLSLTCALFISLPKLRGPELGPLRAVLFSSFALASFVVPLLHAIWILADAGGTGEAWDRMALPWVAGLAGCNALAVGVYGMKFPERYYPRTFDIFGASHQLMHIFVLFAALSYTVGVFRMFDFAHGVHGGCSTSPLSSSSSPIP